MSADDHYGMTDAEIRAAYKAVGTGSAGPDSMAVDALRKAEEVSPRLAQAERERDELRAEALELRSEQGRQHRQITELREQLDQSARTALSYRERWTVQQDATDLVREELADARAEVPRLQTAYQEAAVDAAVCVEMHGGAGPIPEIERLRAEVERWKDRLKQSDAANRRWVAELTAERDEARDERDRLGALLTNALRNLAEAQRQQPDRRPVASAASAAPALRPDRAGPARPLQRAPRNRRPHVCPLYSHAHRRARRTARPLPAGRPEHRPARGAAAVSNRAWQRRRSKGPPRRTYVGPRPSHTVADTSAAG